MKTTNITDNKPIAPIGYNIPENLQEKYMNNVRKNVDIWNIRNAIINRLIITPEEVIREGFLITSSMGEGSWDVIPIPDDTELGFTFLVNEIHGDGIAVVPPSHKPTKNEAMWELIQEVAENIATSMYATVRPLDYYFNIAFNRHDQASVFTFIPSAKRS